MANDEVIARGGKRRQGGRLIALSSGFAGRDILDTDAFGNDLAIDFPSMPDSIDLNRSADYSVTYNPVLPDGLHLYRGTRPMEIPFSFKLHSFDDNYCPEGALTLLKIAARLHAFVLPGSTRKNLVVQYAPAALPASTNDGKPAAGQKSSDEITADAQANVNFKVSTDAGKSGSFYPPVVAWLHLMWISKDRPGISCLGYVKEVGVKLLGPYLRGPDGSFNLPSAAEYSFVFVHRPGYSNSVGITGTGGKTSISDQINATAEDVKERLYTTYNLIHAASFRGLGEDTAPAPAPAATPLPRGIIKDGPLKFDVLNLPGVFNPNAPQIPVPFTPNKTNLPDNFGP